MTIRNFVATLHDLAPLDKYGLMKRYSMTEEEAEEDLKNSWLVLSKPGVDNNILNKPNPTPNDLALTCDFTSLVIGNISLTKDIYKFDSIFSVIGHMHQEVLLYNNIDNKVYVCDYEMDLSNVQLVAVSFEKFLDAFICYCSYYRWFYIDDRDDVLILDKNKIAQEAVELTGVVSPDNIFALIF